MFVHFKSSTFKIQFRDYLERMENSVFQFSVSDFLSAKTGLTKHVLLVWILGTRVTSALTYEALDSERLNFHVDKQTAVRFHQCWGQGKCNLWVTKLDDTIHNTVNKTEWKNVLRWFKGCGCTDVHSESVF